MLSAGLGALASRALDMLMVCHCFAHQHEVFSTTFHSRLGHQHPNSRARVCLVAGIFFLASGFKVFSAVMPTGVCYAMWTEVLEQAVVAMASNKNFLRFQFAVREVSAAVGLVTAGSCAALHFEWLRGLSPG